MLTLMLIYFKGPLALLLRQQWLLSGAVLGVACLLLPAFLDRYDVIVSFSSRTVTSRGCDGHCRVQHAQQVCMCLYRCNRRLVLQILPAGMNEHHMHDIVHVVLQRLRSI